MKGETATFLELVAEGVDVVPLYVVARREKLLDAPPVVLMWHYDVSRHGWMKLGRFLELVAEDADVAP